MENINRMIEAEQARAIEHMKTLKPEDPNYKTAAEAIATLQRARLEEERLEFEDRKNGDELICTWLCDFSQLANGEHAITATGMFAVGVDDAGVTSYTVAEQSLTIEIENNTTGVEKVESRNEKGEMGDEKKEIYDLGGRRVKEITAKGIYIVNGKKTVLK